MSRATTPKRAASRLRQVHLALQHLGRFAGMQSQRNLQRLILQSRAAALRKIVENKS